MLDTSRTGVKRDSRFTAIATNLSIQNLPAACCADKKAIVGHQ